MLSWQTKGVYMALRAEADHRIANSPSVLSGFVRMKARDPKNSAESNSVLLDVSGRIDTVGRLHGLLAATQNGRLNIGDYLEQVCGAMKMALTDAEALEFTFEFDKSIEGSPELGMPLGLLTAELVVNSLKYAHPTGLPLRVLIACNRTSAGKIDFVFEDDRVGFPDNFDPEKDGGLGMHLVRSLADLIHDRHVWTSHELGLRFQMTFLYGAVDQATNGHATTPSAL